MRRLSFSLMLCAVVAISLTTLPRLIAETAKPVASGTLPRLRSLLTGGGTPAARQLGQATAARSKPVATVQTDKDDYHPNEQVFITGTDWLARELVELTITETATDPPGGWTDGPFVYYATSDSRGNIANSDFWTDEHDGGVTFLLTAKGVISGRTAQFTFTDSLGSLAQCANGNPLDPTPCQSASEWVNGNLGASKSTYFEGDSIPYRLTMSGLSTSGTHTVTIEWDTTKSGKHALDYITTFNRTPSVSTANPCAGVTGCGSPTTFAIPVDPLVTAEGVTPIAGNFTMYGGTITAVSAYTLSGTYTGDSSTRIAITFTATTANPVLAWGGHIATRTNWGAGGSAVAISGSPYHTRLVDIDGSGGNQDRSLSADAVIFPASIRITKNAVPDGEQDFAFTTTGGLSPATFSLDDDPTDTTLPNSKLYSNLINFTAYTISETAISGWNLSFNSPPCTVTTANGGTQTTSSNTLTINLKEGEDVSCTFTNTFVQPTLKLVKTVLNDNGGNKEVADFVLKIDTTTVTSGVAIGVSVGQHTASEVNLTGYSPSVWGGDCAANGTVTLAAGENKVCTITNDDIAPKLTVTKVVVNDNGGSKVVSDFPLFVDGGSVTSGVQNTFGAGAHTVSETGATGYVGTITGDCAANGAITLAVGDVKACTITNNDVAPKLTVTKVVVNDNGGSKVVSDFPLFVDGGSVTSGVQNTFGAGAHTVSETGATGYVGTITGDCAANGAITLAPGDVKACTITNDDVAPKLTVTKVVVNDNGGSKVVSDFPLFVDGGSVTSGVQNTFGAGAHTVSETGATGYVGTITGDCAANGSITLAPGDVKACTITNNDVAPKLTVTKVVVNDNGGSKVVSDFPLFVDGGSVTSGVQNTFGAGAHTVSETGATGYVGTITGDCAANGSITLAPGDVKACTITNDDVAPKLTVTKVVVNDNGGLKVVSDFPLFVDGGSVTSGVQNTFSAGAHTVSETGATGYVGTISGDCATSGAITLAPGDVKSCTITNDDVAPKLTVTKVVVNNNGGTKVVSDFPLFVDGGLVASGVQNTFAAGVHVVSETGATGYVGTISGDCSADGGITLNPGDIKFCTITNDDEKGTPGITTAMSWVLKDSATLSNFRTGASDNSSATIVFKLFGPDAACTTDPIHTETITGVSTAGPFPTPTGKEVVVAGTYRWVVSYSGDSRNNPIATNCGDETHTITVGEPPTPPQQ